MDFKPKEKELNLSDLFSYADKKPLLKLKDGSEVKVELELNIKKLMMINRDFNTDEFIHVNMNEGGMDCTIPQALQATYIAYRQANMNSYMDFEEFVSAWKFDYQAASMIFFSLLYKSARDSIKDTFEKAFASKK